MIYWPLTLNIDCALRCTTWLSTCTLTTITNHILVIFVRKDFVETSTWKSIPERFMNRMDRTFRIQRVPYLVQWVLKINLYFKLKFNFVSSRPVTLTQTPYLTPVWCHPQMKVLSPQCHHTQTDSPLGGRLPSCQDHTASPSHPSHFLLGIFPISTDSLGQRQTSLCRDSETDSRR